MDDIFIAEINDRKKISKALNNYCTKKIAQKSSYLLHSYMTPNSIKPLSLTIIKINGYIEEHNGNKYLTLAHTD